MIWTAIFLISIAQGLFLVSLIAYRGSKNSLASRLIIIMLVLMLSWYFIFDMRAFLGKILEWRG